GPVQQGPDPLTARSSEVMSPQTQFPCVFKTPPKICIMSKLTVGVHENNKVPLRFLFFVWQRRQIVINHYMPRLLNDR
ncbi:hypothetical protein VBR22_25510, partial [Klebsiella pneumoniae]|nr:hypothetical protein [Klebsiella pneumoniae]